MSCIQIIAINILRWDFSKYLIAPTESELRGWSELPSSLQMPSNRNAIVRGWKTIATRWLIGSPVRKCLKCRSHRNRPSNNTYRCIIINIKSLTITDLMNVMAILTSLIFADYPPSKFSRPWFWRQLYHVSLRNIYLHSVLIWDLIMHSQSYTRMSSVAVFIDRIGNLMRFYLIPDLLQSFLRGSILVFIVAIIVNLSGSNTIAAETHSAINQKSIAFLGVRFQNDHNNQEPTSEAELSRLGLLENIFRSKLETSGQYEFLRISDELKRENIKDKIIGECGGCEIEIGKKSGADISAWMVVQKVSNLILNINLYMIDVSSDKIFLIQSVDIRGNTDESWTRGINYLVKNHVLNKTSQDHNW